MTETERVVNVTHTFGITAAIIHEGNSLPELQPTRSGEQKAILVGYGRLGLCSL